MQEAAMSEKRWIVLATDGRHVTLGRHSDPSEAEIIQTESALRAQGLAGWLAVTSGTYYSHEDLEVVAVRPLADPPDDAWKIAVMAFHDRRAMATTLPKSMGG
jgi:hypothetical protein